MSKLHKRGECWGDSNASTVLLLYRISTSHSEFRLKSEALVSKQKCYLLCFTFIILGAKPQRLHRYLSSVPISCPEVSVPTCCKRDLFLRLEIFVDRARPWKPPECTTQPPKHSECCTFEIASDLRMLEDLQGIDSVQTTPIT
jgi:hypothetical protein